MIIKKTVQESFRIHCVSSRKPPTPELLHDWLALYNFAPVSATEARYICSSVHVLFVGVDLAAKVDITGKQILELTDEDLFGPNEDNIKEDDYMKTRNRSALKAPAATLLKELNPNTQQGKLVEFFLTRPTPMDDALDHFMIERHTVMTQLNTIARQTGIGYAVKDGIVTLTLPAGVVDPFEL